MAFVEDLSAFIDEDDFGISATLTPSAYPHPSSKTATLSVIFDMQYVEAGNISGNRPVLTCSTANLAAAGIDVGARVTVLGNEYVVKVIEPDGTGISVLILERQ